MSASCEPGLRYPITGIRAAAPARQPATRRHAAEERDELAPFHSITSSARASSGRREFEAERLGGFEVDDELEFGRLFDRHIGRLSPTQNFVHVLRSALEQGRETRSVGYQASCFDVLSQRYIPGTRAASRKCVDANSIREYERIGTDVKSFDTALERLQGGLKSRLA